jgi:cysteinyl-tRNA synthetase
MNDDFNTPVLISVLFDAVKNINLINTGQASIDEENLQLLKDLMHDSLFEVMGLKAEDGEEDLGVTDEVMKVLIELRKEARDEKDWALSDKIRDKLAAAGVQVKDGPAGTTWTYDR